MGYEQSSAKTLIVFSHYPTDYLVKSQSSLFNKLKDNSKHNIVYFGGHRHNTDQAADSIYPNEQWLVGGGGGYGCDGHNQGFVKGYIHDDGTVTTEAAYVNEYSCCSFSTYSNGTAAPGAGSIEIQTCKDADEGLHCTLTVQEQGKCVPSSDGGMVRLYCETNSHIKIDEMSADCSETLAWHMVPQAVKFPTKGQWSDHRTTKFSCENAPQVPAGWTAPAAVDIPSENEGFKSIRFDQSEVV